MIAETDPRSRDSISGERSMSASWGATTPMVGIRCSATRRRASSARQVSRTCRVEPVRRYQGSFNAMPTWANWVEANMAAPPPQRCSAPSPRSRSCTARWWATVNTAPLARPVVPEVKQIVVTRPGSSVVGPDRSSMSGVAGLRGPHSGSARSPGSTTRTSDRNGRPSTPARSVTTRSGATRATSSALSGAVSLGLTGAWTAPIRSRATARTTHSAHDGSTSDTTSPGPIPRWVRPAATRSAAASRSR